MHTMRQPTKPLSWLSKWIFQCTIKFFWSLFVRLKIISSILFLVLSTAILSLNCAALRLLCSANLDHQPFSPFMELLPSEISFSATVRKFKAIYRRFKDENCSWDYRLLGTFWCAFKSFSGCVCVGARLFSRETSRSGGSDPAQIIGPHQGNFLIKPHDSHAGWYFLRYSDSLPRNRKFAPRHAGKTFFYRFYLFCRRKNTKNSRNIRRTLTEF